eukprot:TRINITY_DN3275_c0_g1_i1.p1 TRINITY_DN3275_c0_g1~~TRINITY_DN3275_c0_g1_i1.p1  ORF type:complete len:210 (+),score=44.74 TRINITY_DN3275_c0_g1_i1:46-675(+)
MDDSAMETFSSPTTTSIAALLTQSKIDEAITIAQEHEIMQSFLGEPLTTEFYELFLLAYLCKHDLNLARFTWKRIPQNMKSESKTLVTLWSVGCLLWQRRFAEITTILTSAEWPLHLIPCVAIFTESFRTRLAQSIAATYSHIRVSDCAAAFGWTVEQMLSYAHGLGWTLDDGGIYFIPKSYNSSRQTSIDAKHMERITSYVMYLEESV